MPTALREPRPFSVSEYHALGRAGILRTDERLELIRGQILQQHPISPRHANCVDHLTELFVVRVRPAAKVRVQNPIRLGNHSEPEPDLALLMPKAIYAARHPRADEVLLVVEVADTTLDYDRDVKALLYAEEGITEYWIVNLEEECLEVYRQPGPKGYAEATTLRRGNEVQIEALPDAGLFAVDEVLGS